MTFFNSFFIQVMTTNCPLYYWLRPVNIRRRQHTQHCFTSRTSKYWLMNSVLKIFAIVLVSVAHLFQYFSIEVKQNTNFFSCHEIMYRWFTHNLRYFTSKIFIRKHLKLDFSSTGFFVNTSNSMIWGHNTPLYLLCTSIKFVYFVNCVWWMRRFPWNFEINLFV